MKRLLILAIVGITAAVAGYLSQSSSVGSPPQVKQAPTSEDLAPSSSAKNWPKEKTGRSMASPIRMRSTPAPAYDPMAVMRAKRMTAGEIFEQEDRDPKFAVPREKFLATRLASLLERRFPDASIEETVCKTLSCRIEILTSTSSRQDLYQFVQRPVLGQVVGPKLTDTGVVLRIVFSPEMGDHQAFEEWFEEALTERDIENEERWEELYRNAK